VAADHFRRDVAPRERHLTQARRERIAELGAAPVSRPDSPWRSARCANTSCRRRSVRCTFGVRLELPNPRGTIPAGIKCRVGFQ